jgi:HEPN domain-containing protein
VDANGLDAPEFRRWREQSAVTLEAARELSGSQPGWACFLAEQAAQLALKGLLLGVGADAWGHDLLVLVQRAEALGAGWQGDIEAAARLSRHYIPTRYPDAHAGGTPASHYTPGDAESAIADATSLTEAADVTWHGLLEATDDEGLT